MQTQSKKVLVAGCWHLGSVVGACLADANHQVSLWDQRDEIRSKWKEGKAPIFEPGLEELAQKHWNKNLNWANEAALKSSFDWVVVAYDTPVDEEDRVSLAVVEEGFQAVLKTSVGNHTSFLFTSQLPVGTSSKLRKEILKAHPQWQGHVMYMPENLRLGEAISSFKTPDRIVVGLDTLAADLQPKLVQDFSNLMGNLGVKINVMNLESAEMVKHALNAFLGTCIVFANELASVCENAGANAWDVVASLKQDMRVGPKAFLRPGLGFAGGTIARDVRILSELENQVGSDHFFGTVYHRNAKRNDWVIETTTRELKSLQNKKIVLLGVTYKPNTSTLRRSPAIDIAKLFNAAGAKCVAIDPMADLNELTTEEQKNMPFTLEKDFLSAFSQADAAVMVTEWSQFLELDWKKISTSMKHAILIDSKDLFSKKPLPEFKVVVPGRITQA